MNKDTLPADLTLGDETCGNCSHLKGFAKAQQDYANALAQLTAMTAGRDTLRAELQSVIGVEKLLEKVDTAYQEQDAKLSEALAAKEAVEKAAYFGVRVAKAMDKIRSSQVFFILQQAFPEDADEWEWADFQNLLTEVIATEPAPQE